MANNRVAQFCGSRRYFFLGLRRVRVGEERQKLFMHDMKVTAPLDMTEEDLDCIILRCLASYELNHSVFGKEV